MTRPSPRGVVRELDVVTRWRLELPSELSTSSFVIAVFQLAGFLGIRSDEVRFDWQFRSVRVTIPPRIECLPLAPKIAEALEIAAARIRWPDPSTLSDDGLRAEIRRLRNRDDA